MQRTFVILQLDQYIKGRLGLVIDSTGRDYDMIARQHNQLKQIGYDTYMVFVNTSLDVALARNARRERTIPEYITTASWNGVQSNIGKFQRLFGMTNFLVVDNNKSDLELTTLTMNRVSKEVKVVTLLYQKRWMPIEKQKEDDKVVKNIRSQ